MQHNAHTAPSSNFLPAHTWLGTWGQGHKEGSTPGVKCKTGSNATIYEWIYEESSHHPFNVVHQTNSTPKLPSVTKHHQTQRGSTLR